MSRAQQGQFNQGLTKANITPLADVTTTLIVVFLITMPAIMWNGINIHSAEASAESQVVTPTTKVKDEITTIAVDSSGVSLDGEPVHLAELPVRLGRCLDSKTDRTVVVVPSDLVPLGSVVQVLDIAKECGATCLAIMNETGEERHE
jgi:biopolymer transport protein ExbD